MRETHGRAEARVSPRAWITTSSTTRPSSSSGSIDAVVHTLLEAIVLVVLVVILFLQTWRASIIPLARRAGVADRHLRGDAACSASRSTPCRCSAWCWPSASWWMTPSWWWRTSSVTSASGTRRSRPPARP
ncbi:MAG: efflux RND transporter permease subunit [Stutzerimonas stutzeri]